MPNIKNVILMEGVLISGLIGAYQASLLVFALCVSLMAMIIIVRTKIWILALTTLFTIIWGMVGFEIGYFLHSLNTEIILATICLSLAAAVHMVFLDTNDFQSLKEKQAYRRDC
ncbi:MAG: hypothetical protein M0T74_00370 [Desulfitobacterium hafniense]|nr:hypothetical protein [Desulfitobacterium hafniense]